MRPLPVKKPGSISNHRWDRAQSMKAMQIALVSITMLANAGPVFIKTQTIVHWQYSI